MSAVHPQVVASLVFGRVELRPAERRVLVDGQTVALGSRAFDLLSALVGKRDRVVSKNELLDEVWPGLVVEENNLQVQISGLRRVLGAQAIATVQGLGYRFTLAADAAVGQGAGPQPRPDLAPTDTPQHSSDAAPRSAQVVTTAEVLVADDNRVNRLLLCRSLEMMGHRVSSAENGRQALDMLRQRPFALLLLDLAMPEQNGFELLQLRAADAALQEVSVIVTSALDGVAPVARCIELGADDFLHKPVDPWLLKARVESSLARKQQQDLQRLALLRLRPDAPATASRIEDASMLVARLHGLERLLPALAPQATMELLGDWSTLMLDAIAGQGGELTQFSGDGLMALFSAPAAALRAAQDMLAVTAMFNVDRASVGQAAIAFGLGIASGAVLVGAATITSHRVAHACIGPAVLSAEHLSASCSRLGLPLLMDEQTRAGLPERTSSRPVPLAQRDEGLAYTTV